MSKVIILRGVPGSGKSTWVSNYMFEAKSEVAVISRDDIRADLFGSAAAHGVDENRVTEKFNLLYNEFLGKMKSRNYDIDLIIDNTNCDWSRVLDLAMPAAMYDIPVKTVLINTDLDEALRRNAARDRVVPEHVIRRMHAQLMETRDWEL